MRFAQMRRATFRRDTYRRVNTDLREVLRLGRRDTRSVYLWYLIGRPGPAAAAITDIRVLAAHDIQASPAASVITSLVGAGFSRLYRPNMPSADLWPLPSPVDLAVPLVIVGSVGGGDTAMCGIGIARGLRSRPVGRPSAAAASLSDTSAWAAFSLFGDGFMPLPEDTGVWCCVVRCTWCAHAFPPLTRGPVCARRLQAALGSTQATGSSSSGSAPR